ncbi:MAG: hypothetical protein WBX25_31815 [Rhodomicrobium sp.]
MGTEAGTHIAVKVPEVWRTQNIQAQDIKAIARRTNVGVYTAQSGGGHEYGASDFDANWLLLGYASLSEGQIAIGVDRLAHALERLREPEVRRLELAR